MKLSSKNVESWKMIFCIVFGYWIGFDNKFCFVFNQCKDKRLSYPNVSTTPLWQWGFQQCLHLALDNTKR